MSGAAVGFFYCLLLLLLFIHLAFSSHMPSYPYCLLNIVIAKKSCTNNLRMRMMLPSSREDSPWLGELLRTLAIWGHSNPASGIERIKV